MRYAGNLTRCSWHAVLMRRCKHATNNAFRIPAASEDKIVMRGIKTARLFFYEVKTFFNRSALFPVIEGLESERLKCYFAVAALGLCFFA